METGAGEGGEAPSTPTSAGVPPEPFSNLMETLLANLVGLRSKLDDNSKTTSSLLTKASSLREQIKSKRSVMDIFEQPKDQSTQEAQKPTEQPPLEPATSTSKEKAQSAEIGLLLEREKQLLQIISYLENENQSLSDSVEGCYNTLEVAMDRYRTESAAARTQGANANNYKSLFTKAQMENDTLRTENVALKQKMEHMLAIMQIACAEGDQCTREEEEVASQLLLENENLRQLLQISQKMSNVQ
eukprot:Phypoly_transcript_15280.p1 GENE.Phypoly_transcript_15280~~Phypoly_transcript_15280.p1  ORF type:complete len:260 (+),score=67.46 Phypoly_transcript_15280:51-782(+)